MLNNKLILQNMFYTLYNLHDKLINNDNISIIRKLFIMLLQKVKTKILLRVGDITLSTWESKV